MFQTTPQLRRNKTKTKKKMKKESNTGESGNKESVNKILGKRKRNNEVNDTQQQVLRSLKCLICKNTFKQAKYLPCLHSFCSTCLDSLFSPTQPKINTVLFVKMNVKFLQLVFLPILFSTTFLNSSLKKNQKKKKVQLNKIAQCVKKELLL